MNRPDLEQWKPREVGRLLALVESERRYYQEIVATAPVGFLIVSSDLSVISSNREARELFGWKRGSAANWQLDSLLPESLVKRIEDVLAGGKPEYRLFLKVSGAPEQPLLISIQPLRSSDEGPDAEVLITLERFPSLGHDGRNSRELAIAGAQDAVLLENLDAIVWSLELPSKRFRFVNEKAQQLLGYPVQLWLDSPSFWQDRIHAEDREWVLASYDRAIENWIHHSCEFRARTSDHRPLWLRETARVLQDAEGNPRTLVGVALEVTERKLLEEQFVRAQRFDTLKHFSQRVVAEIGAPVAELIKRLEEALRQVPAAERAGFSSILEAAGSLCEITDRLAAIQKAPVGSPAPFDLCALLRSMEPELKSAAPGIHIELKLFAAMVGVVADHARLTEILHLFLQRARNALGSRGQIIFECVPCEIDERPHRFGAALKRGVYGCIAIQDNGPTLDALSRARLFENLLPESAAAPPASARGRRLNSGSPLETELAHAYDTVRKWGGDILVLAVEPGGTKIQIFLPRIGEVTTALSQLPQKRTLDPPPVPTQSELVEKNTQRPTPTVLIVDAGAGTRKLMRKILTQQGYEVLNATGMLEALQISEKHAGRIGLAIADLSIPVPELRGLVERLETHSPGIRFIAVPGSETAAAPQAGLFPKGTVFLTRPFRLGSLVDKVKELLPK